MKISLLICVLVVAILPASSVLRAQELDGSDLRKEVNGREARINALSLDEQLQLRAAQKKAAEDPVVLAALKKRNEAIQEFRAAIRAAMIKADPSVEPILAKVAIPDTQTP
ncbi:MAG: hypothetical protein ACREIF_04645 [Chthoniobacterales bacterium]